MTDYDRHMDELARRIAVIMEGESLPEVVFACGGMIAVCLQQLPLDIRNEVWAKALEFIARHKDGPVKP